ncbi:TIGR03545 family protein [Paraglaciecola sp. 25GB23A]|uniref:TIGR03545 family protein n=1 Tax=Paraglaciecola sp. 25GB23A TaxID=3156068 RepID=UPI0032AF3131
MKNIIRWPGLIAFVLITGSIAAIIILFFDFWIKLAAQKGLEVATGAEVNISAVEHTFSPFGVSLIDVQLTDPNKPATNQIQAAKISADIELSPLLLRKVIIDNLIVSGVQFGTERAREGEVFRKTNAQGERSVLEELFPNKEDLPSVDEVLARSPLKTTKAIEEVQAAYDRHKEGIATQYKNLPSKDKLAEYKKQIEALSKANYKNPSELLAAKEKFDLLKQEIRADKQILTDFKDSVSQAKQELSPKIAQLKAAPGQDYEQLKALVAGDAGAISDVTTMVFGEKAAQWAEYGLAAFDIVAPMLKNKEQQSEEAVSAGRWLSFDDESGLPELWIKNADISVSWQQENLLSVWHDITYQHDIIGRATTFKVDSSKSKLWQSFKLNGDFWLKENGILAQQNWQLAGLKLDNIDLVNQDKLSSKLLTGLMSSNGSIKVKENTVIGDGVINLTSLTMQAQGSNKMTNIVANTLNQLEQLSINSDVGGVIGDLDLSFSSDLNRQLGSALLANIGKEEQGKLDELKAKLNTQMQAALGSQDAQLGEWLDWEKLADGDISSLEEMLNSKMNNAIDNKKDELKDKLKGKLFGG